MAALGNFHIHALYFTPTDAVLKTIRLVVFYYVFNAHTSNAPALIRTLYYIVKSHFKILKKIPHGKAPLCERTIFKPAHKTRNACDQ